MRAMDHYIPLLGKLRRYTPRLPRAYSGRRTTDIQLEFQLTKGGADKINRDAKTAGGVKFFASDESATLKWTLNRSAQAESTAPLYRLADVKRSNEEYKSNRSSRIFGSERDVQRKKSFTCIV